MLKKIIKLFFIIFLSVGCVRQPAIEEISFSSWGSVTEVQILKQVIKEFENENPEIKINNLSF